MRIKFYSITVIIFFICFIFISCAKSTKQDVTSAVVVKSEQIEISITSELIKDKIKPVPGQVQESGKDIFSKKQIYLSDMVFIPAGEFIMGIDNSIDDHHNGSSDHENHGHHGHKNVDFGRPAHRVYLNSYYIDRFEVTNGKYNEFVQAGGYSKPELWTEEGWRWRIENNVSEPNWWLEDKTKNYKGSPDYPNHPATGISWFEAMAYAKWIGKSLPTEAQWEKAARGSKMDYIYPWGSDKPDCLFANFCVEKYKFCVGSTSIVGSFEKGKSPYGVYDMAGNVWEWCKDWYSSTYYRVSPYKNPECKKAGTKKVLRGGSWVNAKEFIRSTFRQKVDPGLKNYFNGFRCVVESSKVKGER